MREYRRRDDVAFQTRVSAAIAAAAAAVACCFTNGLGWLAVWSCGIMAAMLLCVHLHAYYMRQCDAEELASAREAHRSVCDEVAQRSQEAAALEERLCSISRRGFLINVATGQFLDSTGKRNSVVKLWGDGRNPGGSPDNLKWRLTAEQYVVNVATGQFLDSTGRRDAVVKLWGNGRDPGSSPKNLKWRLTAEGYLVNVATGQFLDSTGKRGAAVRLCGHGSHPGPCPDNLKWMFLACPNNL